MLAKELVREEERPHRDEMNLIEYPLGLVAERVPIDPATGKEFCEIRFQRTITEGEVRKEQTWIIAGDPRKGGLPRGYDLDVFTAFMTEWSKNNFQHYLVSLGSIYHILKVTGKDDKGRNYRRVTQAIQRFYGLSCETYHAIYDPTQKTRRSSLEFRIFSSVALKENDGDVPRGFIRVTPEFHGIIKLGYLKITDINRYWRLPTTYSRRLFQYLDKHRARALREQSGCFELNGHLLAKKLGTLDQTLQSYRPAKLRDVMGPHLDALKADG